MAEPLVSVIVPACDAERDVGRSIRSLLAQTYRTIEVIVVDHGSRDGTLLAAQELEELDGRVRVLSTAEQTGAEFARGLGLVEARGDIAVFQDARGWSAPLRIERQLQVLGLSSDIRASQCAALPPDRYSSRPAWLGWIPSRSQQSLMAATQDLRAMYPPRHGIPTIAEDTARRLKETYGKQSVAYVDEPMYCENQGLTPRSVAPVRHSVGGCPVIAGMATIKRRRGFLPTVLESLADQVDELHIHLNDYEQLSDDLRGYDNVRVTTFRTHGDLIDTGKFLPIMTMSQPGYFLTVDDDILYPPDYVERMVMALEQLGRRAVVGVHGVVFPSRLERFFSNRDVIHFSKSLERRRFVDLVGTGTMAMHSSTMSVGINEFGIHGMADLWLAIACRKADVPRIVIDRHAGWLQQLGSGRGLYTAARRDDSTQTQVAQGAGPWGRIAVAGEIDRWFTALGYGDNQERYRRLKSLGFCPDEPILGESVST